MSKKDRKKQHHRAERRAESRSTERPASGWRFFPIYGIKVLNDDGLRQPTFGDAAIVDRDSVMAEMIATHGSTADLHHFLIHGRLTGTIPLDNVGVPAEHLFEAQPPSYIAVRPYGGEVAAKRHADLLRAMLTLSMFMRGTRLQAFADEPRQVAWSAAPGRISLDADAPPQSQMHIVLNEHVWHRPLAVTQRALRESWRTGSLIENSESLHWDIHREHPICALLGQVRKGQRQERLADTALHFQRAACTSNYTAQLQMAVTTIERLLYTSDAKKLRQRAHLCLGDGELKNLDAVLTARHEFVHDGKVADDEEVKQLAKRALMLAIVFFDFAVGHLSNFPTAEAYEHFLDLHGDAARLEASLQRLVDREAAASVTKSIREAIKHLSPRLTLRMQGPGVAVTQAKE